MSHHGFIRALVHAIDPRRSIENEIPRAFLFAKYAVEYLFRLVGFFLLICLTVGLTLASCTQNPVLQLLPLVMATAFFFYIAITTVGIPVFLAIGEIDNLLVRRLIGYTTVVFMLAVTLYSVVESPVFDMLEAYVGKLFPTAHECKGGLIELDK